VGLELLVFDVLLLDLGVFYAFFEFDIFSLCFSDVAFVSVQYFAVVFDVVRGFGCEHSGFAKGMHGLHFVHLRDKILSFSLCHRDSCFDFDVVLLEFPNFFF
jgi:hypothetical protein